MNHAYRSRPPPFSDLLFFDFGFLIYLVVLLWFFVSFSWGFFDSSVHSVVKVSKSGNFWCLQGRKIGEVVAKGREGIVKLASSTPFSHQVSLSTDSFIEYAIKPLNPGCSYTSPRSRIEAFTSESRWV